MDRDLREAERTGDGVKLLRERLRAGELTQKHIELAARLGHADAREFVPNVELLDWDVEGEELPPGESEAEKAIAQGTKLLGQDLPARIAIDYAERALPAWECAHPGDDRLSEAILAHRTEMKCPCEEHRLATSQHLEVVGAARNERVPVASALANHAVAAFEFAWLTRFCAGQITVAVAVNTAAGTADIVARVTDDPGVEHEWQRLRLAEYVLGLVDAER